MRIASVRAKRAYALDGRHQPTQDLAYVVDDLLWEVGSLRGNAQRFANGLIERANVLARRQW